MGEDLLSLKWNNHRPAFFHLLRSLREKGCHTDVTLACGSRFFAVHRLVLMACSDYFTEVFEHTTCQKPVIVLKDVRGHELEALLDYMYLGEVDVQQAHLPGLIKAAECLRIKGLAVPDEDPTPPVPQPPPVSHPSTQERPAKRRRSDRDSGKPVVELLEDDDTTGGRLGPGDALTVPTATHHHQQQQQQQQQSSHHHHHSDDDPSVLHQPPHDASDPKSDPADPRLSLPDPMHHPPVDLQRTTDQQPPVDTTRLAEADLVEEIKTEHCDDEMENGGVKSEDGAAGRSGGGDGGVGPGAEFQHFLSVEESLARQMFQQAGPSGLHRHSGREGVAEEGEGGGGGGRRGEGGGGGGLYPPHLLGDLPPTDPTQLTNQTAPLPPLVPGMVSSGAGGDSDGGGGGRQVACGSGVGGSYEYLPMAVSENNGGILQQQQQQQQQDPGGVGRKYECVVCGRVFNHRGTLTRHVMIHTGEKPFVCQFCDFRTSRKSTLNYHLHSLHPDLILKQ